MKKYSIVKDLVRRRGRARRVRRERVIAHRWVMIAGGKTGLERCDSVGRKNLFDRRHWKKKSSHDTPFTLDLPGTNGGCTRAAAAEWS